jgi:hypothetical protein
MDDSLIDPVLLAESAAARNAAASAQDSAVLIKKHAKNAHWFPRNERKLLEHLIEKRAAAGDGTSFTKTTFTSAAAAVNADSCEKGAPKTWETCKSKFQKVWQLAALLLY